MLVSHDTAFEVLLLQAGADGREETLFGSCVPRVREVVHPFLVGTSFPEIYLEFPLLGEPFLDVTLLYSNLPEQTRIDSPLAEGCEEIVSFYQRERSRIDDISFGFELDCSRNDASAAGIHFQPRSHTELVDPFCQVAGEPERAALYHAQNARMVEGWSLDFFGMFRGRKSSPLRVCGYINPEAGKRCAKDPILLGKTLTQAGFEDFDDTLLEQAARVLELAPDAIDFQLDVLPDGRLGDMFAIDIRFDTMRSSVVKESFTGGVCADIMKQLMNWGIADERTQLMPDMTFTRGLRFEDEGEMKNYALVLTPAWLKVRWRAGVLQPSKMYMRMAAGDATSKD